MFVPPWPPIITSAIDIIEPSRAGSNESVTNDPSPAAKDVPERLAPKTEPLASLIDIISNAPEAPDNVTPLT